MTGQHQRKILIVDDEHPVADTLAAILVHHGFEVYVAYSGTQAIDIALEVKPDLVLSDVMMSDKNGFEVVEAIKSKLPRCKTILCSGSMPSANKIASQSRGKFEILDKPIHPADLLAKLDQIAA